MMELMVQNMLAVLALQEVVDDFMAEVDQLFIMHKQVGDLVI